jgi:hypothetical protein
MILIMRETTQQNGGIENLNIKNPHAHSKRVRIKIINPHLIVHKPWLNPQTKEVTYGVTSSETKYY